MGYRRQNVRIGNMLTKVEADTLKELLAMYVTGLSVKDEDKLLEKIEALTKEE